MSEQGIVDYDVYREILTMLAHGLSIRSSELRPQSSYTVV